MCDRKNSCGLLYNPAVKLRAYMRKGNLMEATFKSKNAVPANTSGEL